MAGAALAQPATGDRDLPAVPHPGRPSGRSPAHPAACRRRRERAPHRSAVRCVRRPEGTGLMTWADAHQQALVAELARIRCAIERRDAPAHVPADSAIAQLAARFGLSPFERDVLLLCAGVELD